MHKSWFKNKNKSRNRSKKEKERKKGRKKLKAQREYISREAFIPSCSLAACVININSSKWVVLKLSRLVNDPQRQNRDIKELQLLQTLMYRQAKHIFSIWMCTLPSSQRCLSSNTCSCSWSLTGWAIRNNISNLSGKGEESQQNMLLTANYICTSRMHRNMWICIFEIACTDTHTSTPTSLTRADPRQYIPFNNANKHLYCFVWWMAWFMRKTLVQQYFRCRMPGDSERADYKGEGKETAKLRTKTCCTWWGSCSELLYSISKIH